MTALTQDRPITAREGARFSYPLAAGVVIHAGAMVALDATGHATPAARRSGASQVLGVAESGVDNSDGARGAMSVSVRAGVFRFVASSNTDPSRAAIGKDGYAADDQTITSAVSSYLAKAGVIVDLDDQGVWVRIGT